jgi:hypothetical protein
MEGWILLHRKLIGNWVWENPKYLKGWVHCLMRANFKETKVPINGELQTINRGEFVTSLHKFANETGMSIQEVRTFWNLLVQDKMINKLATKTATKITVCNYEDYQDYQQTKKSKPNKPATTEKERKEKKPLPYPSPKFKSVWEKEWLPYRRQMGFPVSQRAIHRQYTTLKNLAGEDTSLAIAIIRQSIEQSWQGLFAVKNRQGKAAVGKRAAKKSRFDNYEEGETIRIRK